MEEGSTPGNPLTTRRTSSIVEMPGRSDSQHGGAQDCSEKYEVGCDLDWQAADARRRRDAAARTLRTRNLKGKSPVRKSLPMALPNGWELSCAPRTTQ